jgi:hypothetical protein
MRRAARPEAEARLRERPVPLCLQHLQYRLLDEAVEYGRHAPGKLHSSPNGLWDRRKSFTRFILCAVSDSLF